MGDQERERLRGEVEQLGDEVARLRERTAERGQGPRLSRRGLLAAVGAVAVVAGGTAATLVAFGGSDDSGRSGESIAPSAPPESPPALRGFPERPTLRPLGALPGHPTRLAALCFSPDGRTLASSEADVGQLQLWDVETLERLGEPLTSAHVAFLTLAFSPDGTTLATGGGDRAELWQVPSLQSEGEALSLPDHALDVFEAVAFSPDGATLATGGPATTYGQDTAEVRLWDVASRRQVGRTLTGHRSGVERLAFSPDGTALAVGGWLEGDGVVQVWDVVSQTRVGDSLTGHQGGVGEMMFSPDSATLAVSAFVGEGIVRFWDTATGTERGEPLTGHSGGVRSMAYSGDGTALVTLSAQGSRALRFWDADTHEERSDPIEREQYFAESAFSADGLTLATHEGEAVRLWRIE